MVVTGPTVIAPLLRQAKLAKRPANLLQWEAIVNDPVGALAAVIAFGLVSVLQTDASPGAALGHFSLGTGGRHPSGPWGRARAGACLPLGRWCPSS